MGLQTGGLPDGGRRRFAGPGKHKRTTHGVRLVRKGATLIRYEEAKVIRAAAFVMTTPTDPGFRVAYSKETISIDADRTPSPAPDIQWRPSVYNPMGSDFLGFGRPRDFSYIGQEMDWIGTTMAMALTATFTPGQEVDTNWTWMLGGSVP